MLKKIDHIAVVVKDIDKAVKSYTEMFGFKVAERMAGPSNDFTSVIVQLDDIRVELIQPLKEGSLTRFLEEKGGGLHHVSFLTDDILKELENLKAQGIRLIDNEPRQVPNGDRIAFVHPSAAENVLIELVQRGG